MKRAPTFSKSTQQDCVKLIELAIREDINAADLASGVDCTTAAIVPDSIHAEAVFVSRSDGIICGVEVVKLALDHWAPEIELTVNINDGEKIRAGQTIGVMSGLAHDILTMERTCLNFMCRLSGISSLTHEFVDRISETSACVLDTRKTTPGWRRLEKYAVACGGGQNHRMGLYDAIMIKDNHLAFFRTQVNEEGDVIPAAIRNAKSWINEHASELPNGSETILQLEVDTLEQLRVALKTDCDIVLLDNMNSAQLTEAVAIRNEISPEIILEASGGVNLDSIVKIAKTGVERISVGAVTHSAINFDIGLDWKMS
jgi:nicotinate-nucleotide pyrophosphorylase (carboxylating)|tara:strand:+ start:333 stop:1274 length:942 start_codon:yes stop_codon:yes gene_type:complete